MCVNKKVCAGGWELKVGPNQTKIFQYSLRWIIWINWINWINWIKKT